jgi:hypothetical protein
VRGGFRAGDPLPYMERNLMAGLFHAAASLGIAESADHVARDGIAGRVNGDVRPRMQSWAPSDRRWSALVRS